MPNMPHKFSRHHKVKEAEYHPLLQEVGEELLVYDPLLGRCHVLNREAALVYRSCDGETMMEQVAERLGPDGESILSHCLQDLEKVNLIDFPEAPETSRRRFLSGAGALIITAALSTPAAAASVPCTTTGCTGLPTNGGGGGSGLGPGGCTVCCGQVGCAEGCPCGGTCACFIQYNCRASAAAPVREACANGGVDICVAGTFDTVNNPASGCLDIPGATMQRALSCSAARAQVVAAGFGASTYQCCACP